MILQVREARQHQSHAAPEISIPNRRQQLPGSSHGDGEPLTQQCPTTSAPPGLTQAPAAPWHGRCGGAWGRCSSPSSHGLLRPLLPDPPGARARLSRQQQSLLRAPHHGSIGRRGKPVLKPRLMPMLTALSVARKLQARHIGTVSVL